MGVLFALNNFTAYSFRQDLAGAVDRLRPVEPAEARHGAGAAASSAGATVSAAGVCVSGAGQLRAEHVCATAARQGRIRRQRAAAGRCRTESTSSPTTETRYETLIFRTAVAACDRRIVPVAEPAPGGSDLRRGGAVLAVRADRLGSAAADRRADLASRGRARQFHGRRDRADHADLRRGQRHLAGARARGSLHARRPGFLGPAVRFPGVGDGQRGGHEAYRLRESARQH